MKVESVEIALNEMRFIFPYYCLRFYKSFAGEYPYFLQVYNRQNELLGRAQIRADIAQSIVGSDNQCEQPVISELWLGAQTYVRNAGPRLSAKVKLPAFVEVIVRDHKLANLLAKSKLKTEAFRVISHTVMGLEGNITFTLSDDMCIVFLGRRDHDDIGSPYALHQMLIQYKGLNRAIVTVELKPALSRHKANISQAVIADYWQAVVEYIALGSTNDLKDNAFRMINYILIAGRQLIPLLSEKKLSN